MEKFNQMVEFSVAVGDVGTSIMRLGHQQDLPQRLAGRFTRQGAMRYIFSIEWKRVFQLNGISHFN